VRELGASGHDTDFSAKRLMVMAANLNEMQEHRQQALRALSAAQKRAATTPLH
jgi:hypothetical protein